MLERGRVNQQSAGAPEQTLTGRLTRINLVAAVAFCLGGSLFALGAALAQLGVSTLATVNTTYLVGGCFFSLGGYMSILLVVNAARDERRRATHEPMRWWRFQPHRRDWLSAVVLFTGTLLFAVSLVAAFAEGLTPRQSNGWIWLPDILGCVCFLVSGHLAMLEVGAGHVQVRVHVSRLVGGGDQPDRLGAVLPRRHRGVHASGDLPCPRRRTRQLGDLRRRRLLRGREGSSKPSTSQPRQERWCSTRHDHTEPVSSRVALRQPVPDRESPCRRPSRRAGCAPPTP